MSSAVKSSLKQIKVRKKRKGEKKEKRGREEKRNRDAEKELGERERKLGRGMGGKGEKKDQEIHLSAIRTRH